MKRPGVFMQYSFRSCAPHVHLATPSGAENWPCQGFCKQHSHTPSPEQCGSLAPYCYVPGTPSAATAWVFLYGTYQYTSISERRYRKRRCVVILTSTPRPPRPYDPASSFWFLLRRHKEKKKVQSKEVCVSESATKLYVTKQQYKRRE